MSQKRIVVVRGGPSSEYAVSMQTGREVLQALEQLGYQPRDIVVSKQGEWLEHGLAYQPSVALSTADVVFIAMHGAYGEDGTIQKICERLHIPFTGSGSFASSIAFNKHTTKNVLTKLGITMPRHFLLTQQNLSNFSEDLASISDQCPDGFVIKPVASGSSYGVEIIADSTEVFKQVKKRLTIEPALLVEERIVGTEATCGVLENYRGDTHYILPAIEIIPPAEATHFDLQVKYDGSTKEICPGRFTYAEKAAIAEASKLVHNHIGLQHYSRSDFIIRDGQPYFLEVNTLPGLTAESLFPKAAKAVGLEFDQLVEHLISTAKVK